MGSTSLMPALLLAIGKSSPAGTVPSIVERVKDGVYVVRDDTGRWSGDLSNSITHQSRFEYQAKKVLDLSDVPPEVWERTRKVRLSVYFMVRDYSWRANPPQNGLDEAFEIVVNGKVHRYPTNCGAPVFDEKNPRSSIAWYDFPLPKEEFRRGVNEIIIRKAPSEKNDDFLYLGIDNSIRRGNSFVSFDGGKTWTQQKLTVPGGNGEYMVRLYLLTKETRVRVEWRPGLPPRLSDPAGLIAYAGARRGKPTGKGLLLPSGERARMEWMPGALDRLEPVKATVEASGKVRFTWLDETGKPMQTVEETPPFSLTLPANRTKRTSGLAITASEGPIVLRRLVLEAGRSYHPQPKPPIDMCPPIAEPKGKAVRRPPSCRMEGREVVLENSGMRCRFSWEDDRLRLTSLYNEYTACEMVTDPSQVYLFLVEVEGKRYAGSRHFRCATVRPLKNGFTADLTLAEPALRATLTASIDDEGLHLALNLANVGQNPVDFKLAFPHLAGLTASGKPEEDYYFFPWGGGIIADTPAVIRCGYGDYEAIYQVMDIFSPQRGGGLYIRSEDTEGWHKILCLRKHIPGRREANAQRAYVYTAQEYKWSHPSLGSVKGIGLAFEYLRRTRGPGQSFSPPGAVLSAHPGDWHVAMETYARWAHRVWKFRPFPSRLKSVHNMIPAGWDGHPLFKDGRYRTDFVKPMTDCVELVSWWEWSPVGPGGVPIDKVEEATRQGILLFPRWKDFIVKDPVTGRLMFVNNPGDYDGYNERFGGLPAFRRAIQTYKRMGALVTLYMDPIRCDKSSKMGRKYGRLWCVCGPDGKPIRHYDAWAMCHDVAEYREWVAKTVKRVMRETGADGVRLDEYGHKGWACFNKLHRHTFAEWGVSQWQKAIAETCRLVRAAMDEVAPGSVLTTEFPGYDYEMQFLDGCITYDLTVQASPLRPLECNLQRFYFPECKPYELDNRGADPQCKKKFWNAVGSFGKYYPPDMYTILRENEDAYQSRDVEPLIPTLARYIYANRFTSEDGEKTIYHFYNATGHTFDGAVLRMSLKPEEHLFDLLQGRECEVVRRGGEGVLKLYLPRDGVACVARLRRRLSVAREGNTLVVKVKGLPENCRLVLGDREGRELASLPARDGRNAFELPQLPGGAKCVKLMQGKRLVDIAELPGSRE